MVRPRTVAENLRDIRERIALAAYRAGRREEEIRLVAVSKLQPPELVAEAVEAGVRELGENYVQEAEVKFAALGACPVTKHFLGHLQKNKSGRAAALFDVVQCVDSLELAETLGRRAVGIGRVLDALIEVNISGEASKFGTPPERALDLAAEIAAVRGLQLRGVMGIGPLDAEEASVRKSFQLLARIFGAFPVAHRQVLSMGMTADFEMAIAEGSTLVRVGTGIFGPRRNVG